MVVDKGERKERRARALRFDLIRGNCMAVERIVEPNDEQRSAIYGIVSDDVAYLQLRNLEGVLDFKPQLVVHRCVTEPISQSLSSGLPESPHEYLAGGRGVFLSGARELSTELASRLTLILAGDNQKALYVPHAYVLPAEIDLVQDEFEGHAVLIGERVYLRFAGQGVDPELVRGAFARMIGCYSVAWLIDGNLPDGYANTAIVSIFDGEGWALVGQKLFSGKLYAVN